MICHTVILNSAEQKQEIIIVRDVSSLSLLSLSFIGNFPYTRLWSVQLLVQQEPLNEKCPKPVCFIFMASAQPDQSWLLVGRNH